MPCILSLFLQFPLMFSQTFRKWMQQRPWLYRMLSHIDVMERGVTSEFMSKYQNPTCLVIVGYYCFPLLRQYCHCSVNFSNASLNICGGCFWYVPWFGLKPIRRPLRCSPRYLQSIFYRAWSTSNKRLLAV